MSKITLHMARKSELLLLQLLQSLGSGLHWKPKDPMVFLLRGPVPGDLYLFATDGVSLRVQRIQLFRSQESLWKWQDGHGALPLSSLAAWVEIEDEDADNPLEFDTLTERPLQLQEVRMKRQGPRKDWESDWIHADLEAVGVATLLDRGTSHIRPFPDSFQSWLILLRPQVMAAFAATFPEELAPSMVFVPEPQVDTVDPRKGITWAKYWAFHAVTLEPLGVIMGVRSADLVKKITEKRGPL